MRHLIFGQKLSRDVNARKALANNLASNLLENGKITTTLAKAKFARPHLEKLITLAKKNKLKSNRKLASLVTKSAFTNLTSIIGPAFINRPGGYTRIVKLVTRTGDSAPMARIELLEYEKKHITAPRLSKGKASHAKKTASKTKIMKNSRAIVVSKSNQKTITK